MALSIWQNMWKMLENKSIQDSMQKNRMMGKRKPNQGIRRKAVQKVENKLENDKTETW